MSGVNFRFGTAEDTRTIAELINMASGGLFDILLGGLLPGLSVECMLSMAVADTNSPFHFGNALVATCDGKAAGVLIAYPYELFGLPPQLKALLPKKRVAPVAALLESRLPPSLYVNTLAVHQWARGRNIARWLLGTAEEMALDAGYDCVTLHARAKNKPAIDLYTSFGYKPIGEVSVPCGTDISQQEVMLLMRRDLPAQAGE